MSSRSRESNAMANVGTLRDLFAGFEKKDDQATVVRDSADLIARLIDLQTRLYSWGPEKSEPEERDRLVIPTRRNRGIFPRRMSRRILKGGPWTDQAVFPKTWQGIIQDGAQLS